MNRTFASTFGTGTFSQLLSIMIRAADSYDITVDKLLSRVTQEQIIVYYLGTGIDLNRVFSSPFRTDANPSCAFFYGRTGRLYIHDFAEGKFYSFMDIVMRKLKCNYYNALKDIHRNLENISYFNPVVVAKVEVEYTYTASRLTETYFAKHCISKTTLTKFGAKMVDSVFKNNELWGKSTNEDPIYVYEINDRCKIYRPLTKLKKNKWRSNTVFSDVYGMKQLPKKGVLCIITSSVKDMMVLHEHGFPAICFNSEVLPQRGDNADTLTAVVNSLQSRFRYVISLFDNDEVGIRNANILHGKYGIKPIYTQKCKDVADYQQRFMTYRTNRELRRRISKALKL